MIYYCSALFLYRSWAPCFARFACRPKLDLRPAAASALVVFCGLRLRRAASLVLAGLGRDAGRTPAKGMPGDSKFIFEG